MQLFAYFLRERLKATPDGDGLLLDHTTMLYGSGMSDSNLHVPHNLPICSPAAAPATIKGGRHARVRSDAAHEPVSDPARQAGRSTERLGDSTGKIEV